MFCQNCGKELDSDAIFCEYCGKVVSDPLPSPDPSPDADTFQMVRRSDVMTPPPIPEDYYDNAKEPQRAEKSGRDRSKKNTPVVIVGILCAIFVAFVIVQYGNSLLTLFEPKEPMPPDFDTDPPTVLTQRPETGTTVNRESTSELNNDSTPVPEVDKSSESNTESDSVPRDDNAARYNPVDYETTDYPALADFNWVTYDIAHGMLPTGMVRLENFEEIRGGWKMYIIDDPNGEYGSKIERLCICAFGEDENGKGIVIRWGTIYNGTSGDVYDDEGPSSIYYGTWEYGVLDALGSGRVNITDFWYANDHEYAVGRMTWPDGIPALVFLVRP